MDLATIVMITIGGFTPGYRWHDVMAFPIKDMATCRANVGPTKLEDGPMDRVRTYRLCLPASPRVLSAGYGEMRKPLRPWKAMKVWHPLTVEIVCGPLDADTIRAKKFAMIAKFY